MIRKNKIPKRKTIEEKKTKQQSSSVMYKNKQKEQSRVE